MSHTSGIIAQLGSGARKAAFHLAQADNARIDGTLSALADGIMTGRANILQANDADMRDARANALPPAMLDRLMLDDARIDAMAQSVRGIRALKDPCGRVLESWTRPNGLKIEKVAVPIGVLGMIYESRPNVTIDAAALCLKSRNAVILRGGSESFRSAQILHNIVTAALKQCGLPEQAVSMVPDTDRAHVGEMLAAADYIDVMIPRGGKGLTSRVMAEARMPVFAHLDGNCHVYVHESADPSMALSIIRNAKLRRTGICGAAESLLFDMSVPPALTRDIVRMLLESGVEIAGDEYTQAINPAVRPATEEDWGTEYLDKKISVKFVRDVTAAAYHINRYGSHHTDSIICTDDDAAAYFLNTVDSAIVMRNASTQFADGGEFGFGAEIGIGTGKLHARGPVGLEQLTTFKYRVTGNGQLRP